jgi:transposase, IS5 family
MSPFQPSLFEQSKRANIAIDPTHELVTLAHLINWTVLIALATEIREQKVKKASGPQPQYRALLGAMALMAIKNMTYREAEDLIAYYAPARYLCELMDSDMRLDHVSIFEFAKMLGPEGLEKVNEVVLGLAKGHGLLDTSTVMSDTTAQEAAVPYPNEVGLMGRFAQLAKRFVSRLGGKFESVKGSVNEAAKEVKSLVRAAHLFAKGKKEKNKIGKKIYEAVKGVHADIDALLQQGYNLSSKAGKELTSLVEVMRKLLPQIKYFHQTGKVARGKIIHLQMPSIYSIVRGKAGKAVEFGLKWGISRIGGGFVLGFLLAGGRNASDTKFCIEALNQHQALFGEAPEVYGFDRGGHSPANIRKAKKLGVKHVGIAPKGKAAWSVDEPMRERIVRERARVEGSIGTVKSPIYGFNKPRARSTAALARCGHRAILGFNMRKLVREWVAANEMAVPT